MDTMKFKAALKLTRLKEKKISFKSYGDKIVDKKAENKINITKVAATQDLDEILMYENIEFD